jgi:hypothetical protein
VGKFNKGEELFRVEVLLKGGQGSFCNEMFFNYVKCHYAECHGAVFISLIKHPSLKTRHKIGRVNPSHDSNGIGVPWLNFT